MTNIFLHRIKIAGIVKPGQVYILINQGCELIEPSELYTIRTDEEIGDALFLDINIANGRLLALVELAGAEKVSEEQYMIRVNCLNKDEGMIVTLCFLLHRLRSFKEEWAKTAVITKCFSTT